MQPVRIHRAGPEGDGHGAFGHEALLLHHDLGAVHQRGEAVLLLEADIAVQLQMLHPGVIEAGFGGDRVLRAGRPLEAAFRPFEVDQAGRGGILPAAPGRHLIGLLFPVHAGDGGFTRRDLVGRGFGAGPRFPFRVNTVFS